MGLKSGTPFRFMSRLVKILKFSKILKHYATATGFETTKT